MSTERAHKLHNWNTEVTEYTQKGDTVGEKYLHGGKLDSESSLVTESDQGKFDFRGLMWLQIYLLITL